MVRTDALGQKRWQRMYGSSVYDYAMWIDQTDDEGFIIAGTSWSDSSGGGDIYLIKTDSSGSHSHITQLCF